MPARPQFTTITCGVSATLFVACSLQDFDRLGAENALLTTESTTTTSSSEAETSRSSAPTAPPAISATSTELTAATETVASSSEVQEWDASASDGSIPEDDAGSSERTSETGTSAQTSNRDAGTRSEEPTSGETLGTEFDSGAPLPVVDTLDNADFEIGSDSALPIGWTAEGTAGAATYSWKQGTGRQGPGYLDVWWSEAYTIDVYQVVSPIPNGTYTLSIWQSGGAYTEQYVYVSGYDESDMDAKLTVATVPRGDTFAELTIPSIPVTSGSLRVGVYSSGPADAWSHFDDVSLVLVQP